MPGLDGTGRLFEPLRATLGERVATVVIRYPERQVLGYEQLLPLVEDRLPGAGAFLLVAESFSGPLALALAAQAPRGLAGVALCNSFVGPPAWWGLRCTPLGLLARLSPPGFLLRRYLVGSRASAALTGEVRGAIAAVAPQVLAARTSAVLQVDARAWLKACPVPLLYLRGTDDRLVPERCLEEIAGLRPGVEVARIPGPHLLLQAAPAECARRIGAFASGLG